MAASLTRGENNFDDIVNIVTCSRCQNLPIEEPKTLTKCFHVLCRSCLEVEPKIEVNKSVGYVCPKCSSFNDEDSVKYVKCMSLIAEAKQKSNEPLPLCDCEKTNQIKWRCDECQKYLCESCKGFHDRFTKGHSVQLVQISDWRNIDKQKYCQDHRSLFVEKFCKACFIWQCKDCKCVHTAETKTEFQIRMDKEIRKKLPRIAENICEIQGKIKELENIMNEVRAETRQTTAYINEVSEQRINDIRTKQKQMISKAESANDEACKKIRTFVDELKNESAKLENVKQVTIAVLDIFRNYSMFEALTDGLEDKVKECSASLKTDLKKTLKVAEFHGTKTNPAKDEFSLGSIKLVNKAIYITALNQFSENHCHFNDFKIYLENPDI